MIGENLPNFYGIISSGRLQMVLLTYNIGSYPTVKNDEISYVVKMYLKMVFKND